MKTATLYSKPIYHSILLEAFLNQIIVYTYRLLDSIKTTIYVPDSSSNVLGTAVYAVLKYVDNNVFEVTIIKNIASKLGYSQSYISHAFKGKMGMTLQNYICHKKVEAAIDLMKYKKVNITQISEMLNYNTVQANSRFFDSHDQVPSQAITMGIRTIMQARKIMLVAKGESKADIIYDSLYGPITTQVPTSVLQLHPNLLVILDEKAASRLMP